jgi:hypothetical protein
LRHLRSKQSQEHSMSLLEQHLQASMTRRWEANSPVERAWGVWRGETQGKTSSGKLIFLDLEYDVSSRRVHEVGICNARGETIVDCFTSLSAAE